MLTSAITDATYKGGIVGSIEDSMFSNYSRNRANITNNTYTGADREVGTDEDDNNSNSVDPNVGPTNPTPGLGESIEVNGGTISLVDLTDANRNTIAGLFNGRVASESVFSTFANNLPTQSDINWTTTLNEKALVEGNNESTVIRSPRLTYDTAGAYVFAFTLAGGNIQPGDPIRFHNFTSVVAGHNAASTTAAEVAPPNVDDIAANDYVLLDSNYNRIDTLPSDNRVIFAAYLNAGAANRMALTRYYGSSGGDTGTTTEESPLPETLPDGSSIIIPVDKDEMTDAEFDAAVNKMLETVEGLTSTDERPILRLTSDLLDIPQEPTQAMKDAVKEDQHEFVYKLDTVNLIKDARTGYYVFKINIPEEYVGKDASEFRLYAMNRRLANSSAARPALFGLVNGLLNTAELTNLWGVKIDKLETQMLAVVLLQAGESFSMYLAKMLILLLAGCDAGIGLGAAGLLALGGFGLAKAWRRR